MALRASFLFLLLVSVCVGEPSRIEGPVTFHSEVYPDTTREYWVYVPEGYDSAQPACVLVVQDGLGMAKGWRLPEVMDKLIAAGEMPKTIGIFVNPGVLPGGKKNRSFEYDSPGGRYARMLIEELLPEVGKSYSLSDNPNDRCIAGASSGGHCALNAAWERPDAFRRVLSTIGSFTDLRGGHNLEALVRKTEPKPIRVYLADGSNDLNNFAGNWFLANQTMLSSLEWAGYDVAHDWGDGGHSPEHGRAIMPQAMRWLWRDYPQPIAARERQPSEDCVVVPGKGWRPSGEPAPASAGSATVDIGAHHPQLAVQAARGEETPRVTAMTADPRGWTYCATAAGIQYLDSEGRLRLFINPPNQKPITALFWKGDSSTLCAVAGGKVYQRELRFPPAP
ncbi:enterobactin/ferric enterobactin esterase [Pirellulimonas nuda]|uniref:Enterobactin/ferric enterobactin esterase n=1 Tax=Pirellulimonas nuda TaxID=2528009 RepID=A0A518DGT4_9BACT|nr:alpha/beta hydrolase-fold protein [Pirellulimonas nuda]QDU90681.1 enterobactin/ferric enterobactin esterase [Pirellulimonas nuda]